MKSLVTVLAGIAIALCGCGSNESPKIAGVTPSKTPAPSTAKVTVGDYELGPSVTAGNVSLVPIYYSKNTQVQGDEISLAEARKLGLVEIIEIPGAEEVNRLRVHNKSDRSLLLIGGELLLGGKQDRIVAHDVIVPPGKTMDVDVDCVEHGRWEGASEHFDAASQIVPSKVREAAVNGDQGQVWDNVAKFNATAGVTLDGSGTIQGGLNSKEVEARIGQDLPILSKSLGADNRLIGVICIVNGELTSMDLFANPKTFQQAKESLLRGYLAEAAVSKGEISKQTSTDECKNFLSEALNGRRRRDAARGIVTVDSAHIAGTETMDMGGLAADAKAPVHGSYIKSK